MPGFVSDPLERFAAYREKFKSVAGETFDGLVAEAQIDATANRETCDRIEATRASLSEVKKKISWGTFWCAFLWVAVAAAVACGIAFPDYLIMIAGGGGIALVLLLSVVHPALKRYKKEKANLSSALEELTNLAWQQMTPLNDLYDWDIFPRMVSKTVPILQFDPYFTEQRLFDLKRSYDWNDSFNNDRSVLYSHSGLINGNPFVICRTRRMEMVQKTYQGHLTIYWTTTERDADGRFRSVSHSETLYAHVTAPFPTHPEETHLIYANKAAPTLVFSRRHTGLATRKGSVEYKRTAKALRRKSEDLKHSDYAMMSNEEFETVFDTRDRNDNQQFALLFTPLAQENILKLLKDTEQGYGDDFDFLKSRMINTVIPQHLQGMNLELSPRQFRHYDLEKAKEGFLSLCEETFRALYFSFAPLLAVPLYQQLRPVEDIYGKEMKQHSAFWEHEALANYWGSEHFQHPSCVTSSILKTRKVDRGDGTSEIVVTANGFRYVERCTYVSKYGGDGRFHNVPVYWDEYLPVTGSGTIKMAEDNSASPATMTQRQRLGLINDFVSRNNLEIYRRHIASKLG